MASPGALIQTASIATGMNPSTVESLYNNLRDFGEIPKGPRGKNAISVSSLHVAKLLIAMCVSENVKDATAAVARYSRLQSETVHQKTPNEFVAPLSQNAWRGATRSFPKLNQLDVQHHFIDALVALIETYVDVLPRDSVKILMQGPSPWAGVEISINSSPRPHSATTPILLVSYRSEDEEIDNDVVDASKERQRRRFVEFGRDLRLTASITEKTLETLGKLLRDE